MKLVTVLALLSYVWAEDCYLSCDQVVITYDKEICYRNCDQKLIVGATVGSFVGLCFLICFICYCRHRNHVWLYLLNRKLKQKNNIVQPGTYTLSTFQAEKKDFIHAITKSEMFSNFFFEVKKKKCEMTIQSDSFTQISEGDFLTKISFNGKDRYSKFFAQGYFLCKNGHPYVWFIKRYEPYELAIQYGLAQIILFESSNSNRQAWTGTWSAVQQQDNGNINGQWNLIMKVRGISNHLQQIGSQLNI